MTGFTGLEDNPQRVYEADCSGFNPVNPLNPVNPVECICVSTGGSRENVGPVGRVRGGCRDLKGIFGQDLQDLQD